VTRPLCRIGAWSRSRAKTFGVLNWISANHPVAGCDVQPWFCHLPVHPTECEEHRGEPFDAAEDRRA